ncbi:uncharacterized protein LOC130265561 [Oenanthe melanoleuca]|uniref:uncharacterized protein LOC130265561 n=1 Tax=Oenanthe melanoleuca TaxID=2939378 RepID=UPI0024C15934|nr:uncharacterized protein LOC130265561 [Oenanthe melanoleuca]
MESLGKVPGCRSPAKLSTLFLCLYVLVALIHLSTGYHPYQPHIWTFRNVITGALIGQTETNTPAWTVRLSDIFTSDRSIKTSQVITVGTYWCPSNNPGKEYCIHPSYWFCGYWGCETIVTGNRWKPPKQDEFLNVTGWPSNCISRSTYQGRHPGNCTHLTITVLKTHDPSWAVGRLWSVYRREDSSIIRNPDRGTVIQISDPHHTNATLQ